MLIGSEEEGEILRPIKISQWVSGFMEFENCFYNALVYSRFFCPD